jgi:hypothetical protein
MDFVPESYQRMYGSGAWDLKDVESILVCLGDLDRMQ